MDSSDTYIIDMAYKTIIEHKVVDYEKRFNEWEERNDIMFGVVSDQPFGDKPIDDCVGNHYDSETDVEEDIISDSVGDHYKKLVTYGVNWFSCTGCEYGEINEEVMKSHVRQHLNGQQVKKTIDNKSDVKKSIGINDEKRNKKSIVTTKVNKEVLHKNSGEERNKSDNKVYVNNNIGVNDEQRNKESIVTTKVNKDLPIISESERIRSLYKHYFWSKSVNQNREPIDGIQNENQQKKNGIKQENDGRDLNIIKSSQTAVTQKKRVTEMYAKNVKRERIVVNGRYLYCCKWKGCHYTTYSRNIVPHIHTEKLGIREVKCSHTGCDRIFKHPQSLAEHEKNHLCGFNIDENKYGNSVCSISNIMNYYEQRKGRYSYKCLWNGCSKVSDSKQHIHRHIHGQHICPHRHSM